MRSVWEMITRAYEIRAVGATVLAPGIAVRRRGDGKLVAVLMGGHRERVDRQAVLEAGRRALADWPGEIAEVEIIVEDPRQGAAIETAEDRRQFAAAEARRQRRAARWRSMPS